MPRKQRHGKLKLLAVIIIVAAAAGFFLLRKNMGAGKFPLQAKQQTGYKAADRQKLERLIHEEVKND